MAFVSSQFAVAFAMVAAGHFALPLRWRWVWLLGASLTLYGLAEPLFLVNLLAATVATFVVGRRIAAVSSPETKRAWVTLGVGLLLAHLVAYKYTPFFNESARTIASWSGLDYPVPALQWLLPIGISFYTCQLIAYLVDVYRGERAEPSLGRFALFVSFFPKIAAGPIERARHLLPQFRAVPEAFNYGRVVQGLQFILWGLFKKVLVADRIAPLVSDVYARADTATGVEVAFATWLYAFQIFCDFSGYTDMALGLALILGYKLAQNFDRPYFATSVQDFWKRWHISLTSWLTDYVYTPLTRQRRVRIKLYYLMIISLVVTFVLSGLWHGAGWTFVAWGALHGSYLVVSLLFQRQRSRFVQATGLVRHPTLHRVLRTGVTFGLVCLAYILFRADSLADARAMFLSLGTGWTDVYSHARKVVGADVSAFLLAIGGIAVVIAAEALQGVMDLPRFLASRPMVRWGLYYASALLLAMFGSSYGPPAEFIYYRF